MSSNRGAEFQDAVGKTERRRIQVLLAEDNPGDVYLVREALSLEKLEFELLVRSDGEQMSDFIDEIDTGALPCPDVVLLDLNLPRRSGVSVLERLRQSTLCGEVPVIVVTSSASPQDREMATRLGASSYFQKPSDFDEFMRLGSLVRQFVSTSAAPVR
jgi:two-component system, chemotaxis family, response regulator Rcp1